MRRITNLLGIMLPLAIYFALALPQLELPGLHNDEAVEAGLQAAQILSGHPITSFRDTGITLAGRTFPLMVQDYIGAFNVYFLLPFFAAFGASVYTLRLYTVLIGAVTIIAAHGFLRTAAGARPAFVGALLLGALPSFVFWQRQGVFVTSLTATLAMVALWVGARWAKHPSPTAAWRWAALLGLVCGAGLYAKLLFVWILGGAAGALAIVNAPSLVAAIAALACRRRVDLRLYPRTPTLPDLLAFAAGLAVGIAPLLLYNWQSGGTLASVGENFSTSYYGVNNANLAENLRGRIDQFQAVIGGRDHLWYLGGSFGNAGWETALSLSAIAILARAMFRRNHWQLPAALLLMLVFGVAQTSFTVSGLFPTHFSLLLPLLPLIIAVACEIIFDSFYEPLAMHLSGPPLSSFGMAGRHPVGFLNMGMMVLAVGLAWLVLGDIAVAAQYHAALNRSGGLGTHSDAIYRLTDYVENDAPPGATWVAMDWGFAPQVRLLSQERIAPLEAFGYAWEADEQFVLLVTELLNDPNAVFVFHFPQETIFPRREVFDAIATEQGLQVEQLTVISRRDGAPIFEVVRAIK